MRIKSEFGVRLSNVNAKRAELLKVNPEWHKLSYQDLAVKLETGWANVARLMKLLGYAKPAANTCSRAAKIYAVINDPERDSLSREDLAKKHGISMVSLYRYLATLGKKPKTAKKVYTPDALDVKYGRKSANVYRKLVVTYAVGKSIANLTVVGLPVRKKVTDYASQWFIPVKCVCAREYLQSVSHLNEGKCCCRIKKNTTHGFSSHWMLHRLKAVHASMLRRCKVDPTYTSKNITVCPAWSDSTTFFVWALSNSWLPGKSIDRRDNDKGYSPANCRFVSDTANANNRSSSVYYDHDGFHLTLAEHCRRLDLHYPTVSNRILALGWSIDDALTPTTTTAVDRRLVYLGYRKSDGVFTVGKSSSWETRKKCLVYEGYEVVALHDVASDEDMGLLEFLLHDWCDRNYVNRGVASKSKGSKFSPETMSKRDLLSAGFKFHKVCSDLINTKPYIVEELGLELNRLMVSQLKPEAKDNKCHQRIIRENTLAEDLEKLTPVFGAMPTKASDFTLSYEAYAQCHRDFIKRYEWLGTPGSGIKWAFTARYNGELGGVVLASEPYNPEVDTALIARGACAGWTPKNLGSMLVMFSCRWMASNTPKRKFIAYTDSEANEIGQIYQACNFMYLGASSAFYGVRQDGSKVSFQTLKRTSNMKRWMEANSITLAPECFTEKGYLKWSVIPVDIKTRMRQYLKLEKSKLAKVKLMRGKYMLILGANRKETKLLRKTCGKTGLPYPKRLSPIL